jgi:hypothetical protein
VISGTRRWPLAAGQAGHASEIWEDGCLPFEGEGEMDECFIFLIDLVSCQQSDDRTTNVLFAHLNPLWRQQTEAKDPYLSTRFGTLCREQL